MNQINKQPDETTQIINQILQYRYENKMHCPYFSSSTGECQLKSQKYKPQVIWQDSHSRGSKSTRFSVIQKYHGTTDCDLMYNHEKQSFFDCIIMQDFKQNQCILGKDLNQSIEIISKEVFKEYGVTPKKIPLKKIFKSIRGTKSLVTKEMENEFHRWIRMHYEINESEEESYIILGEKNTEVKGIDSYEQYKKE
jgi:hypothetical protein